MTSPAIKVEHLSKQYHIGGPQARYKTFRDSAMEFFKSPLKKMISSNNKTIWALRDVSFEIQPGEVVGVIGRNGAGKSTLLKLLSHITSPTEGKIEIYGRVGSLLEVGTGFHPELTGRDNIYLNGAILGMKRWEINKKFDEIVGFAEIEKFLDTPAKHYSSGMYMRLAFAVAAHLEPEILLVDEVLAVGDMAFQKKCLGKMGEVAKEGRTVLFVSHNMAAITQLCDTSLLLDQGTIQDIDTSSKIVRKYLEVHSTSESTINLSDYKNRRGSQEVQFDWVKLCNYEGRHQKKFSIGDDIKIIFQIHTDKRFTIQKIKLAIKLKSSDGIPLCNIVDVDSNFHIDKLEKTQIISVGLKDIRLYPDVYIISLWVGNITSSDVYDFVEDSLGFEIIDGGRMTTRSLPRIDGLFFWTPEWEILP
jgi:lipopolysaccharide transport system ATP-binding protein